MCVAIQKSEGLIIPEATLQQCWKRNPDGAGFMYAEDGQLHIEKGFMSFDEFMEAWTPHQDKPAAIHFRITTHGETDTENTHPFRVGKNLGFIHNGVINAVDRKADESRSDTFHFNQKILVPIYKRDSRFAYKDHFKHLIKEYIGWSKLVFLNNKGHSTIINEAAGEWHEGVWYSNTSYKIPTPAKQAKKAAIVPAKESSSPDVFTIGSRVEVNYRFNNKMNGTGVLEYFTGGLMVGVKMDATGIVSLVHMDLISLCEQQHTFVIGDWVVRDDDVNLETVGEVVGLSGKDRIVVKWIGSDGMFSGPDYVISADKLSYWWNVAEEEYMQ